MGLEKLNSILISRTLTLWLCEEIYIQVKFLFETPRDCDITYELVESCGVLNLNNFFSLNKNERIYLVLIRGFACNSQLNIMVGKVKEIKLQIGIL